MPVSRHEFKLENGNKFYVRRFDAFLSLKVLGEVQKKFLAPLAAIMEARDAEANSEALNTAVNQISKGLDGDSLVELVKKVLNPDFVSVVIDNSEPSRLDEGALNLAIDGVYDVVYIVYEVLRYNYADLFTRGRTLIGQGQSNTASQ